MNDETQQPQNIQPTAEKIIQAENIITPEMLNNLKTLKSIADKDFKTIENLISIGGIQEKDGQILKNEVLKKMFSAMKTAKTQALKASAEKTPDKNQQNTADFGETAPTTESQCTQTDNTSLNKTITPNSASQNTEIADTEELQALGKSYPTAKIIEFLSNKKTKLSPESLSELVKIIETNAVKNYLDKENLTKKQQAQNEAAKQKLTSSITSGKTAQNGLNKIFTRETIKKMSPAEFKQFEEIIAKQIELGLLK